MKYAKLINGFLIYAPNPILVEGSYIGNPARSVYESQGYKLVRYTEPEEAPEGYDWAEVWTETGSEIVQGWEAVELPLEEPSAVELLEIILGGEEA